MEFVETGKVVREFISRSHNFLRFSLPEGEGSYVQVYVHVGLNRNFSDIHDQKNSIPLRFGYAAPDLEIYNFTNTEDASNGVSCFESRCGGT